jgi:hypothetical protein
MPWHEFSNFGLVDIVPLSKFTRRALLGLQPTNIRDFLDY